MTIMDSTPVQTAAARPMPVRDGASPDLLDRWTPVADWVWAEAKAGLLVEPRITGAAPGRRAAGRDLAGQELSGIEFSRSDHLNMSSHPQVIAAAQEALARYGTHAAGPAASPGSTSLAQALEARLAEYLSLAQAVLFPDHVSALAATVQALLADGDHLVLAGTAPRGAAEGAALAGAALTRLDAITPEMIGARLTRLRADHRQAGLLVAVEAGDDGQGHVADLAGLQAICNRHRATLLVDVTRDLGLLGATGRGLAEAQGMTGAVDIVTGDLGPVFAAPLGFAASGHGAFRDALRYGASFGAPVAPVHAAAVMATLDLAEGPEGAAARTQVLGATNWLGAALKSRGFVVEPTQGAEVRLRLGRADQALRMQAALQEAGVIAQLDLPQSNGPSFWRFLVQAAHRPADLSAAVSAAISARSLAADPAWHPGEVVG